MSTDVQAYTPQDVQRWDSHRRQVVKDILAPGISDAELDLFEQICMSRGLDPFDGQIHAVMRWDARASREKMTIQTGIDGMRSLAEDTGEYDGSTPPLWCGKDGKWVELWIEDKPPFACKVGVRRKGFSETQWAIGRYSAYVQTTKDGSPNSVWQKRGPEQLAKCIESVALRMTFPRKLKGLYTNDEMAQADNATSYVDAQVREAPTTAATVTEEAQEAPQATTATPAPTLAQLQAQVTALCEQYRIDGRIIKHWREALGLPANIAGIKKVIDYLDNKEDRARPYVYTWGLAHLITPDVMDRLFSTEIQHKETGIASWQEFWKHIQQSPDDWDIKLKDMLIEPDERG